MTGAGQRAAGALAAALTIAGCVPQVVRDYRTARSASAAPPPSRPAAHTLARPATPSVETAADPISTEAPTYRETAAREPEPEPTPFVRSPLPQAAPSAPLAATRPAWEARPVTPDAITVAPSTHIVQPGDTLGRIAQRTGTGAGAIAHANDLAPPFTLDPGRRLVIPGGRYHVVQPGQSGIAIARAYGVEWSRIVAANDLSEPYVLRAGERILIPGIPAGSTGLAERAAAFRLDIDDILTGGEPTPAPDQAPARPADNARRVLPPTALVAAPSRLTGGFAWPLDGRVLKRFGRGASGERNDGIEIAARAGTPVHAAANGVVAYAGDGIAALGGLVIVKHGDGWASVYGHASRLLVRRGQAVRQGQTIALSGDTGHAEIGELHFELRKGRTPVDPLAELPRR